MFSPIGSVRMKKKPLKRDETTILISDSDEDYYPSPNVSNCIGYLQF